LKVGAQALNVKMNTILAVYHFMSLQEMEEVFALSKSAKPSTSDMGVARAGEMNRHSIGF
jgi:hypothetical protein